MRSRLTGIVAAGLSVALLAAAPNPPETLETTQTLEPTFAVLRSLPETEGRQILSSDGHGNAYVVQLVEKRVFEIDGLGHARLHSRFEADQEISGALRAAVGAEGDLWVFGFSPHSVRVFQDGEELDIDQPGAVVTGMTVTGGRPTLSLAAITPQVGVDVGKDSGRPKSPPFVVQLDAKGRWQPWIERGQMDRMGVEFFTVGILGFETRLAGDEQGRLLMARHYKYDVREYKRTGKLSARLLSGDVEMEPTPREIVEKLEKTGRKIDRSKPRPKPSIDSIAWSPEGEVLILATTKDGYTLDRWSPALQEHHRLPLEDLEKAGRLQMVATRNGLLFLPAVGAAKLLFVPWDFLRDADWESLRDGAPAEAA